MLDFSYRPPAVVERDEHPVQLPQPPAAGRNQTRRERPVAVPGDAQLDLPGRGAHRLQERTVPRVTAQRRLRVALLIAAVLGQLSLQPPLEAGLDQLPDEPAVPVELHPARVDLNEHIIQHPGLDQTLSALRLNLAPLITRRLVDNQQCVSFRKETHPLHTPFDTLPMLPQIRE